MKEQIIKNAVKCLKCKTVIESRHRHDFVFCECGAIAVDGGHDYLKRVGDPNLVEELSEFKRKENKMEIKLLEITPNAEALIEYVGGISHDSNVDKYDGTVRKDNFIKKLIEMGHESVLEHASASFSISRVSRAFSHQLVRHRLASYTQRSQRYVSESNFDTVLPLTVALNYDAGLLYDKFMDESKKVYQELINLKIPKEDARFVLPNATETEIVMSANFRQWRHMINLRTSKHAQWEINFVFVIILKELAIQCPKVFGDLLEENRKK